MSEPRELEERVRLVVNAMPAAYGCFDAECVDMLHPNCQCGKKAIEVIALVTGWLSHTAKETSNG